MIVLHDINFFESLAMPVFGFSLNGRDRRIDLVRGFALLAVFIDHIPGNALHMVTLQSHAVSDAADIFVFLAGYSAWLAYGRAVERDGIWAGLRRLLARCGRVYATHVTVVVTCVAIASVWFQLTDLEPENVTGISGATLARALALYAQPTGFNVLPLYICLLLAFPLVWVGLRWRPRTTVAASAGLWLLVNLNPSLNLPEWLSGSGWAFNPFEWQFLFTLGAVTAALNSTRRHSLRRTPRITSVCWIFLAELWVLVRYSTWNVGVVPSFHVAVPADTLPHLVRLLSGLAIIYLVLTSDRFERLVSSGRLVAIEICGKHSLAVFGLGTVLSMVGRLTFQTAGEGALVQAAVNGLGVFALIASADLLERKRQGARVYPTLTPHAASATVATAS